MILPSLLIALLFGSALTIQLFFLPALMNRISDRSTVTRVSTAVLRNHHLLSVLLLIAACVSLAMQRKFPATAITGLLLLLNLYQRFWIFTKMHLVKQPIGVQDLIQPDNLLREEFNRLQRRAFLLFRIHTVLLLIDLIAAIFALK
jgi:hypothetical protein